MFLQRNERERDNSFLKTTPHRMDPQAISQMLNTSLLVILATASNQFMEFALRRRFFVR